MPRIARIKSRSGIYHVMMRGVNKQIIFEEEEDKKRFFETLRKYKVKCNYELYSYCFMDNHVHLLMRECEETISNAIKKISSSYVYWYNSKYGRNGHLFQDRFKSEAVEDQRYFLTVLRYIHQNPLKAGLTKSVFDSEWTSMHEYTSKPLIIDTEFALRLFSADPCKGLQLFIDFMKKIDEHESGYLDDIEKIRVSDKDIKDYLMGLGIKNVYELQQMKKVDRDKLIVELKMINGVSIRQLSRLTGISKSVLARVR